MNSDPNVVDIMTKCNRSNVVIHYLHNYIMVQGSHTTLSYIMRNTSFKTENTSS